MKIGLSLSRCILDIIEERVNIEDVLVIIARTDFDPTVDEEWKNIWYGYSHSDSLHSPEWSHWASVKGAEDQFREVILDLWNDGKIHQPRKFGARPIRRSEYWLETVLPSEELERNPAAKKAWNNFQTIAGLTDVKLDKDYW
jgi:hypothetical protein